MLLLHMSHPSLPPPTTHTPPRQVYRGGYSPAERRQMEAELHGGGITALAATNALEVSLARGFAHKSEGDDMVCLGGHVASSCLSLG
jgi:hypothetical protein